MQLVLFVRLPYTILSFLYKTTTTRSGALSLIFSLLFFSLQAQFYPDSDGDGLGSAWHSNTSATGVLNNLDADDSNSAIGLSFAIPDFIYGVANQTTEIYYRNLIFAETANLSALTFNIVCSEPSASNGTEKWSFTPALSGTYPITMTVKLGTTTLATGTSTIVISPDTHVGVNQRDVLMFGHSYIAGGWQLHYLNQKLTNGNNPPYALVGSNSIWVSPNIMHDGYAAMGWDFFTGGSSPIGTGSAADMQAFYDAINGGNAPEYVVVQLDVNDFIFNSSINQTFTSVSAIDAVINNQWATHAEPVITALTAEGCSKVAICITPPPSSDPGMVGSLNEPLMQLIQKRIAVLAPARWGGRQSQNIHLIPTNTAINTATEYEDFLHPSNASGYNKVAGQVYAWLKFQFQTTQSCGTDIITWTGGTGSWDLASNWDCNCIPSIDDLVVIDGTSSIVTVPVGYTAYADSLVLRSNAQLTVASMAALSLGDLGLTVQENSTLTVPGTMMVAAGGEISNFGSIHFNTGTLSGAGVLKNKTTGEISGNGTIGIVCNDAGDLSPGDSPGALTFSGNLLKSQGGYLAELASTSNHDVVTVNGIAQLSGVLTITLLNSFMPLDGDYFDVLMYPMGKIGVFQSTVLPDISPLQWTLDYQSDRLRLMVSNPLPVELVHFSGKKERDGVHLTWTTASEYNTDVFEIERRTDNLWESISAVNAKGFADFESTYTFIDTRPTAGMNYYRLKTVDFDKTTSTSQIVAVQNGQIEPNWYVSKNETGQAFVHWPEQEALLEVSVYSLDGRMVLQQFAQTAAQLTQNGIQLPTTTSLFLVKVVTDSGVFTKKF